MRTSRKIIGVLIAALAFVVLPAASAQADPFTISIDNAIMNLGSLSNVRAIDSELDPPDPPATLTGDLTGNTVNVPKANFVFPPKQAEVSAGITATINMEANDDITGTFDSATGQLVLDASLKATVTVLGSNCVISPIDLELSSDNVSPYLGQEFADGLEGEGVVGASWTDLPAVTGGGSCGIVGQLTGGPGGIAMSHGVHDFKTCETDPSNPRCSVVIPPQKAPVLNSAPPSSTDQTAATFTFAKGNGETQPVDGFECTLDSGTPEPCNSGTKEYTGLAVGDHSFSVKATNSAGSSSATSYSWTITELPTCPDGTTGTPPNCVPDTKPSAKLGALKVQPKQKTVKRGKKAVVKVKVKVKNVGEAAATGVKVCVKAPKKLVKVKKCVSLGQVAAGKVKTAKFAVKAKRKKGQAVLKFTASSSNAGKKTGKAKVRIK
jgi:hypothetical protein